MNATNPTNFLKIDFPSNDLFSNAAIGGHGIVEPVPLTPIGGGNVINSANFEKIDFPSPSPTSGSAIGDSRVVESAPPTPIAGKTDVAADIRKIELSNRFSIALKIANANKLTDTNSSSPSVSFRSPATPKCAKTPNCTNSPASGNLRKSMAIDSPKVSKKKMALDAAKMHFDNSDALAKKDGCEVDSSREKSRGYVASAKAFADYKDFSQTGHQLLLAGQSSLAAGDYVEASKIYTKAAGSFILAKDFVGRDSAMSLAGEALFLGERYAEAANVFTEAGNLEKAAKMRELAKMQAANVAQISVAGSEK